MLRLFAATLLALPAIALADWPQWLGQQRDGIWREPATLQTLPKDGPKIHWRLPVGGGYAGPAVVAGRVFITDRQVKPGQQPPKDPFAKHTTPGTERILCIDDATGKTLWTHEYPCDYGHSYSAGPRTTPIVEANRLWTLGAEGDLFCLDINSGKVLWHRKLEGPTPLWGFAGHPLIDGDKLICTTSGQQGSFTAFNKNTGEVIWSALPVKDPGYAPPMIFTVGSTRQLIAWHPTAVNSLNPDTGEVYWSFPFGPVKNGVSIATPRYAKLSDGRHVLYITDAHDGSLMLQLDPDDPKKVTQLWKRGRPGSNRTDAIHSLMSTPVIDGNHIYGIDIRGELRCLDATTGDRVWEALDLNPKKEPLLWSTSFLVKNADKYFITTDAGDLIIARLSPAGYEELSRAHLLDPTNKDSGRMVLWCHPAYANASIYWRNDKELIRASLSQNQ